MMLKKEIQLPFRKETLSFHVPIGYRYYRDKNVRPGDKKNRWQKGKNKKHQFFAYFDSDAIFIVSFEL